MPLIASLIRSRAVPSPSYVKRTVTSHSKPRAAESSPRRPGARTSSPTGGSRTGSETGPRRPQARDLSGVLLERRSSDEELLSSVRPLTRWSERAAGHRRACGRLASTHRERGIAGTTERQMPQQIQMTTRSDADGPQPSPTKLQSATRWESWYTRKYCYYVVKRSIIIMGQLLIHGGCTVLSAHSNS